MGNKKKRQKGMVRPGTDARGLVVEASEEIDQDALRRSKVAAKNKIYQKALKSEFVAFSSSICTSSRPVLDQQLRRHVRRVAKKILKALPEVCGCEEVRTVERST